MALHFIQSMNGVKYLADKMKDQVLIGLDIETTGDGTVFEYAGLDPHTSRLLLIQFSIGDEVYILDMTKLPISALEQFRNILQSKNVLKLGHNLTFEWKHIFHQTGGIKGNGIELSNVHDTMLAEQMIWAGIKPEGGFSLEAVVLRRIGVQLDKSIRETFIQVGDEAEVTFSPSQLEYAAFDVLYLEEIYDAQMKQIERAELQRIYNLDMNLIPAVGLMEWQGIDINADALYNMREPFQRFIASADRAVQDMFIRAGAIKRLTITKEGYRVIKLTSSQQKKEALWMAGVKVPSTDSKDLIRWDFLNRKKKSKGWEVDYFELIDDEEVATAIDAFTKLDNPFLRALSFHSGAVKLYGTYVEGLIKVINPKTKRIHPGFNILGAPRTGRFSSNKPNFQNLPNDKKLKALGLGSYSIRKALIAGKGAKLLIADYSGIELVILAANSGDERLMDEILIGDIHSFVTIHVLGHVGINGDNKDEPEHKPWRDGAKTLSYGIAYGTTGRNLAETLNLMLGSLGFKISAQEGDELIEKWYSLFPKTAAYLASNARKAVQDGFVTDAWGRRRNWDRNTFQHPKEGIWKKRAAEREGKNAPIQGTSATMTKLAMLLFYQKADKRKARLVITVHDELVVRSTEAYAPTAAKILAEAMEEAIRQTLPKIADIVGKYKSLTVSVHITDKYDK